jgi:hypothetical protein
MEPPRTTPPEGHEACWVDNLKKMMVLRDSNNVKYKIHKYITRTSSSQKQPHAV